MPEFHDLSETYLNDKGQSWGNLGYWKESGSYSQACRALANLLADELALDQESCVMDAGFGAGDQLLEWLNTYSIKHIRGINFSKSQTEHAKAKLSENGYTTASRNLLQGSASHSELWAHLINNASNEDTLINKVVALDCVYHFRQKARFFSLAHHYLLPKGRLGLTDFILNTKELTIPQRLKSYSMFAISRIPNANIVTQEEYEVQLRQVGFEKIEFIDISQYVMPKFGQWLRTTKQHSREYQDLPKIPRLKYSATAGFLEWAYTNKLLSYVLITASKP